MYFLFYSESNETSPRFICLSVFYVCIEFFLDFWPFGSTVRMLGSVLHFVSHLMKINKFWVVQVILEYCIIPLGSSQVHKNSPIVRSVLIAGPQGSGKRLLVNAICTETGATLFDLSPANIVGKYPGKSGLVMLLHLVSKVSR